MARFKELCIDVNEPAHGFAEFWAAVAGCRVEGEPGEIPDLVGGQEYQGIALCPVPEPKTVKHRVHLDVYAESVSAVEALGATMLLPAQESGFAWSQLRDPQGGEFCVFVREQLPAYRVHGIGIDSTDAEAQARWWAEALGGTLEINHDVHTVLGATPDPVLTMDFAPVPEPKTVKNRIHWDVYGSVGEFTDRGATVLWEMPRWVVLADPEGNEFCVFPER